jgi:hypothetical protein
MAPPICGESFSRFGRFCGAIALNPLSWLYLWAKFVFMQWFRLKLAVLILSIGGTLWAAPKPHVITFGKWTAIELMTGPGEDQPERLKARPLYVDGKLKEFTLGAPHEITERLFVVQRVLRVNDSLPSDTSGTLQWIWQHSGWLIVDRGSGHISQASLPQFDPEASVASWYRDYVAYCGVSADGKKTYATVVQLGRRKAILQKPLSEISGDPGSPACGTPTWQRQPARVTFVSQDEKKFIYAVRGHVLELTTDDDDEEGTE